MSIGRKGPLPRPEKDRFLEKVRKGPSCWIWTGSLALNGYGIFCSRRPSGKYGNEGAHRAAWRIFKGEIGEFHVLHKCDVRACVRLSHLFLGTAKDNCIRKGRHSHGESHSAALRARPDHRGEKLSKLMLIYSPKGEAHAHAKLKNSDISFIRANAGKISQSTLARMMGLKSQASISHIINRKTWKHLP